MKGMPKLVALMVVLVLVAQAVDGAAFPLEDSPYLQPFSTRTVYKSASNAAAWPVNGIPAATPVVSLAPLVSLPDAVVAATAGGLYLVNAASPEAPAKAVELPAGLPPTKPGLRMASGGGWILVVNPDGGFFCPEASLFAALAGSADDDVVVRAADSHRSGAAECITFLGSFTNLTNPVVVGADGGAWIGDAEGLWSLECEVGATPVRVPASALPDHAPELELVRALAYNPTTHVLAVSTHRAMFHLDGGVWRWVYRHGFIAASPSALAFDSKAGSLWMAAKDALTVMQPNLQILRFDGIARNPALAGLPFANMTAAAVWHGSGAFAGETKLFVGTINGIVIRHITSGTWSYYSGPRWIAGSTISALAISGSGVVVAATETGLTLLSLTPTTLASKVKIYEAMLSRHDRYGLAGDCGLAKFGQVDSWYDMPNDNNGLWTGLLLGGLSYKYAVTGAEADRALAWHYFEGLELLNNVTNIKGYPARSVWPVGTPGRGAGLWWNSTNPEYAGKLEWKGDTSSDEITGHFFGAAVTFRMGVAKTAAEKARVVALVTNLMDTLIEHDYLLFGHYGNRTTWGVWSPRYLNGKYSWRDERGLNSLQVMGFLSVAYELTGDAKYTKALEDLIAKHGYDVNIINTKITWPKDDNFSDDELNFTPLATMQLAPSATAAFKSSMMLGMEGVFARIATEKSPLWNTVYAVGHGGAAAPSNEPLIADARDSLRQWPTSILTWPTDTTQRIDLVPMPVATRGGGPQAVNLIPYDEQIFSRWNSNPFKIANQGSGMSEPDPGVWLLPYWMAVYHGLIAA
ncbi:two component regulator propeller domain-containing protein [Thecamonas trahens ATCC 50062]|uniref:Two component regulator propeller domain-containing protein n=1 Tax=Thecamonas trahens ATCC 50062 TaxID=461836 RepID=A0A0L0D425_THETB|nr:two component regulator propeller domain-containing protein [Thecamonas trahens ATCC 50062]KNC47092.1 two component regulator propeller domain-containing protein [Thecamonas trahens ATCC 50062]|eukprot:XP_013759870.1 two component regulator propeller domain-containing protein [Thecamonas trahens ATCC 50062]